MTGDKDVLLSIGVIDNAHALTQGLGLECSGIVRKLGPEVKSLDLGDRVVCVNTGCFASVVTASEKRCSKVPEKLSFIEAATMTMVYCTAIHSLIDVAKIKNENVRS